MFGLSVPCFATKQMKLILFAVLYASSVNHHFSSSAVWCTLVHIVAFASVLDSC